MTGPPSKRDFLAIPDFSPEELLATLDLAARMKSGAYAGQPLVGKTLAMIFAKSSTRTRVSFEVGMAQLGGHPLFLSSRDIQLGRGEPIRDMARVLSRYVQGILIRTYSHDEVEELARYATVPVINGLTDWLHPCQVMADLLTIREHVSEDLASLTVAWIGDGNNMANSWINAAYRFGFRLRLAVPEGYDPDGELLERARKVTEVVITREPRKAALGADVVNTDVWASMGQEEEAVERARDFARFRVDDELMRGASDRAIFLHCLPAHRGGRGHGRGDRRAQVEGIRAGREPLAHSEGHPGSPDGPGGRPMTEEIRRTPLHAEHVAAGAKMVPFAGYEMPIQYPTGITAEHNAVRSAAGLFDVSHMGEFELRGAGALDLIQYLTTNDASAIEVGQAQYSTLPRADGTLLDDLLVYRFADHYLLVVNASNRRKDFDWIAGFAPRFGVELTDRSDETALLALQGPRSQSILARLTDADLDGIGYYHFATGAVAGRPAVISRTGYTGEDGFELYVANDDAAPLWRAILGEGAAEGVIPAGLGCRDSLRLEMGYALYGNDLDESRNPLEAGLGWVTKLAKGDFIAGDALRAVKEQGTADKLVGFRLLERGFPRSGYEIAVDGRVVGKVTSGTLSPSLGVGIGMGYVLAEHARPGTRVQIVIRSQPVEAEVVRPPFYTAGSIRR